jgi:ABC-2 type transport system permease protein
MGLLMDSLENNDAPVGYVDRAGVIEFPLREFNESDDLLEFLPFQEQTGAMQALEEGRIQAYFIISKEYRTSGEAELVYLEEPGQNATRQFYDLLRVNLVADQPEAVISRIVDGDRVTVTTPDGSKEFPKGGPPFKVALPLILAISFVFLLLVSSGFLMEGVVKERENRTMEVLLTSISPFQMVAGKIMGVVGISLTQLAFWILIGFLAVFLGGEVFNIAWFQNREIDWPSVLMVIVVGLPSYVLAAAMMFTIGSTVTDSQEGQAIGPVFFLLFMVPIWFLGRVGEDPQGSLAILFSMLPFASLTMLTLRNIFTAIPEWQIWASFGIQSSLAIGGLWVASKAFRLGMLRYGQRISLRRILQRENGKPGSTISGGGA